MRCLALSAELERQAGGAICSFAVASRRCVVCSVPRWVWYDLQSTVTLWRRSVVSLFVCLFVGWLAGLLVC